jgi:hypothetical protein
MIDSLSVAGRPRYSATPLPPYSYVPGHAPHPASDARGHMFGLVHEPAAPLAPERWQDSDPYRRGVDLFNHGYYWEAHEAWESLWHAAGRQGPTAAYLKALIKLAAAAVKAREGNPAGVARHARRSLELVGELRRALLSQSATYCGASLALVEDVARRLSADAAQYVAPQPALVLTDWLPLGDG